jgi:hypothetical protein
LVVTWLLAAAVTSGGAAWAATISGTDRADRLTGGGAPERLSAESMRFTWIADGGVGRMLGDYEALSFVGGHAVPVFSIASEPTVDGTFQQAIFARVR